jgi:hypothetical protein
LEGDKEMRTKYLLMSSLLLLAFVLAACAGQVTPPSAAGIQQAANTVAASTQVQGVSTLAASTEVQGQVDAASTLAASTAVQTAAVDDLNTLMAALQAADVKVEPGDSVNQPFLSVQGQAVKVNGQDVQVFLYDNAPALEAEAAKIAPDASTIGTNMPSWMSDPHFYKLGRMLVLYVGQDPTVIEQLNRVLGPQFAGK